METLHIPTARSGVHTTEPPQMRPPSPPTLGKHDFPRICKNWADAGSTSLSQNSSDIGQSSQRGWQNGSSYDSTKSSVTPDTDQSHSSVKPSSPDDGGTVPPFPVPRKLKKFEKAAEAQERGRYSDIVGRLEKPLVEYVEKVKGKKNKLRLGPTAIRPVMLGTTIADAKLWIVVLCDKSLEKCVTKFLNKQWVRDICRPSGNNHPALEILVAGSAWPVSKILAQLPLKHENQYADLEPWCGIPMCFFDTDNKAARIGTLGGPLRVFFDDGSSKLMGMTSGHAIQDITEDTGQDDTNNRDDLSDSESDSDLEASSPSLFDDNMAQTPETTLDAQLFKPADQLRVSIWESSSVMLPILRPDTDKMRDCKEKNYDWTLVHLDDMPLPEQKSFRINRWRPLNMPTETELERPIEMPVMILSAERPKYGYLRTMPARMQFHPGKSFIDIHLVRTREGYSISNGDSGSWVMDMLTMQVYGHLVAADVFGDGYVVPLLDSFNDMKRCLAAKNIAIERHYGHTQKLKMGTTDTHKPLGVESPDGTSDSVDADDVLGIPIGVKRSYVDVPRVKKMQKAEQGSHSHSEDLLPATSIESSRGAKAITATAEHQVPGKSETTTNTRYNEGKSWQNMPPLQHVTTHGYLSYVGIDDEPIPVEQINISGMIDKGFFLSDRAWTCYRRNYFSCTCSFSLYPPNPHHLPVRFKPHASEAMYDVFKFAMTITAVVSENDAQTIDLVQATPKRDKGLTSSPERVELYPKESTLVSSSSKQPTQVDQIDDETSIETVARESTMPRLYPTEHTFERIQFNQATANNGKRRADQQHYNIVVELHAYVGELGRGIADQWVRVAHRKSVNLIVRGRSPGHYRSERRDSAEANTQGQKSSLSAFGYQFYPGDRLPPSEFVRRLDSAPRLPERHETTPSILSPMRSMSVK
ncbi:hypothetical protein E8E14_008116 [Neopestalotiopsis sp. 37M]|nr:hypothetical protein E8E14_008116 [Neopestalotiopsis sp. 37M]